jgi:hypothetical protein
MSQNDDRRTRKQVVATIREFLRRDRALLIYDVNERSVTHRLAGYVQTQFRGWDVDCEYNRNYDDPKRLNALHDCDARLMRCYPVSTRINSVGNDDKECCRPWNSPRFRRNSFRK